MAAGKAYSSSAATNVPSGTTKASPVAGPTVDLSAAGQTATLTCSLQNGSSPPTSPCILVAQISGDGTAWRDFLAASGDTLGSSFYSFTARLPPEARFGRWIAYSNAGNAVTVTFESSVYSPS